MFNSTENWVGLLTLTALEIVLSVDNLLFIAVLTERLPPDKQRSARQMGLLLACVTRLLLLSVINWLTHFTQPLFTVASYTLSGRDLILMGGGLFLLAKSTSELHRAVVHNRATIEVKYNAHWLGVILQIVVLDIVFSIDSVITAVGMAQEWSVMALAIIIAVGLMLWANEPINRIIRTYPSLKTLGLSFLLLVGLTLIADGGGLHIPRAYLYFAMAFSTFVEWLNIRANRQR